MLLVSVLAHAGTVEAMKNSQRNAIQEKANIVLEPYWDAINKLTYSDLMTNATRSIDNGSYGVSIVEFNENNPETSNGNWVMESAPVFFMLQDSGALVLQNSITLYEKNENPSIVYQNIIEVISTPYQGEDTESYWLDNNGLKLSQISQELLADSIQLAISDALKKNHQDEKQQTFRFYQEGKKTYERGYLMATNYNRLTIRTLRGWIKSVPIYNDDNPHFKREGNIESIATTLEALAFTTNKNNKIVRAICRKKGSGL